MEKMAHKLRIIGILIISFACMTSTVYAKGIVDNPDQPFSITVSEPYISEESVQYFNDNNKLETAAEGTQNRLNFTVEINNITNQDYKNVWYRISLNEEVKPFLAAGIVTFTSDKMDILSKEHAFDPSIEDKEDSPKIWGFTYEWGSLLTTTEEFQEVTYYDKTGKEIHNTPEEIMEALKNVSISVHWKGGKQEVTLPLILEKYEPVTENVTEKADD